MINTGSGDGRSETSIKAVSEKQELLSTFKKYVPEFVTVIDWLVAPVDQTFPLVDDEVKIKVSPAQIVVPEFAAIVGVDGIGGSVSVTVCRFELQLPLFSEKLYVPALKPDIVTGKLTLFIVPEPVPVQLKLPVPDPLTVTVPFAWLQLGLTISG